MGDLQCGGVVVGNCNVHELRCGEFWFGEMWCRGVAVWGVDLWRRFIVGVLRCGVLAVWGSCSVGKLQYGVVALCRSFGVGSFGVERCGVVVV